MKKLYITLTLLGMITAAAHANYLEIPIVSETTSPCGLAGTVEERIHDCSFKIGSGKEEYVLVTRTKNLKEVYKNPASGLVWSERLSELMNNSDAIDACSLDQEEMGGLKLVWVLPPVEIFKYAEGFGINVLPRMKKHAYWTDSPQPPFYDTTAYIYIGASFGSNRSLVMPMKELFNVRCVAVDPIR